MGWHVPREQRVRRQAPPRTHPPRIEWLRIALVEAGQAAGRSKNTYLGALPTHPRTTRTSQRGPAKAAVATGHSILVIIWHLLSTGEIYTDLGADYFDKRRTNTAHRNRLVAQLEALGLDVTLTPKAA